MNKLDDVMTQANTLLSAPKSAAQLPKALPLLEHIKQSLTAIQGQLTVWSTFIVNLPADQQVAADAVMEKWESQIWH